MKTKTCPLCKREVPELLYDMHRAVDEMVIKRMKRDFPGWSEHDGVCEPCLERYKSFKDRQMAWPDETRLREGSKIVSALH